MPLTARAVGPSEYDGSVQDASGETGDSPGRFWVSPSATLAVRL